MFDRFSWLQVINIHFCIITLYRLVAMSLLPLKQLLYGSKDGGVTIFNQDNKLNDVVLAAAKVIQTSKEPISLVCPGAEY